MHSSEDDFINIVFRSGELSTGKSHIFKWAINSRDSPRENVNTMVSLHEVAHSILNATTSYGLLCMMYSELFKRFPEKTEYNTKYNFLLDNSDISNEAYAVWFSLAPFMTEYDKEYSLTLLKGYPNYLDYYQIADRLHFELTSTLFKDIAVSGCLMFCFQSRSIIEKAINSIDGFDGSMIDRYELPNERLSYLLDHFKPERLKDFIAGFLEEYHNQEISKALRESLNGDNSLNLSQVTEETRIDLFQCVLSFLDKEFNTTLGPTIAIKAFKSFRAEVITRINEKLTLAGRTDLIRSTRPAYVSAEMEMLSVFEMESLQLFPHEISCSIVFPWMLDDDYWLDIFTLYTTDPHVYIQALSTTDILAQYALNYPDQRGYLEQRKHLTCIRVNTQKDGNFNAVVIPFENTNELNYYLQKRPDNISILASVRLSALQNDLWYQIWWTFIREFCQRLYIINDVSLESFLTDKDPDCGRVYYSFISGEGSPKPIYSFVFAEDYGDGKELPIVTPCSEAHAKAIMSYLDPIDFFVLRDPAEHDLEDVSRIMGHMIAEERVWQYL